MSSSDHRRKRLGNTEVCREDVESGPVLSLGWPSSAANQASGSLGS